MLVLASTSPYRRELLARLHLPFRTEDPAVDESPQSDEMPAEIAARLACAKALAVAARLREQPVDAADRLVIGSDQVATIDGRTPIGKPGTHERAVAQLRAASGHSLDFHTALTVAPLTGGDTLTEVVTTHVRFRTLDDAEIERYLRAETPYDCAGAAKSEGLGITLLSAIDGPDPTALIGLPLIALCRLLTRTGYPPLATPAAN